MMHIREMFEHTGYKIVTKNELSLDTKWDVMWHHEYSFTQEPFKTLIKNASPNQIVNHVPGSGFYTSKASFSKKITRRNVRKYLGPIGNIRSLKWSSKSFPASC